MSREPICWLASEREDNVAKLLYSSETDETELLPIITIEQGTRGLLIVDGEIRKELVEQTLDLAGEKGVRKSTLCKVFVAEASLLSLEFLAKGFKSKDLQDIGLVCGLEFCIDDIRKFYSRVSKKAESISKAGLGRWLGKIARESLESIVSGYSAEELYTGKAKTALSSNLIDCFEKKLPQYGIMPELASVSEVCCKSYEERRESKKNNEEAWAKFEDDYEALGKELNYKSRELEQARKELHIFKSKKELEAEKLGVEHQHEMKELQLKAVKASYEYEVLLQILEASEAFNSERKKNKEAEEDRLTERRRLYEFAEEEHQIRLKKKDKEHERDEEKADVKQRLDIKDEELKAKISRRVKELELSQRETGHAFAILERAVALWGEEILESVDIVKNTIETILNIGKDNHSCGEFLCPECNTENFSGAKFCTSCRKSFRYVE